MRQVAKVARVPGPAFAERKGWALERWALRRGSLRGVGHPSRLAKAMNEEPAIGTIANPFSLYPQRTSSLSRRAWVAVEFTPAGPEILMTEGELAGHPIEGEVRIEGFCLRNIGVSG
jgi:hypothetical protein